MDIFFEGFFLQASLILALGTQNVFVLESGLRKNHHVLVATVSSICDTLLVAVGVLGAATIFVKFPTIKVAFGILGVSFLVFYGLKKIRESRIPSTTEAASEFQKSSVRTILLMTLGFSLLNPHVYLDTVILVGGYSSKFQNLWERAVFGGGASTTSFFWFFGLSLFSAAIGKKLNSPKTMARISLVSGIVLILLASKLSKQVWAWIAVV